IETERLVDIQLDTGLRYRTKPRMLHCDLIITRVQTGERVISLVVRHRGSVGSLIDIANHYSGAWNDRIRCIRDPPGDFSRGLAGKQSSDQGGRAQSNKADKFSHETISAMFASSPICATRIETVSPAASAASSVTMMPVPVSSTEPPGTGFARNRYSMRVSN